MPHIVLRTHSPLRELVADLEPFAVQADDTVWRLRDLYLNPAGTHALADCLVVRRGQPTRCFGHLAQRESDGAVIVRLYPVPHVASSPAIRRLLALLAEAIAAHSDAEIAHTTIPEALSDRYVHAPDAEPAAWDPLLPAQGLPRPLDWAALFGSDGAVEIEIGSGKGTFLVTAASRLPGTNFLAIEWAPGYAAYLADRVRRRELTNVRVVRAEAARFFADHVADASVRCIHLYFPDPWPKKRHHKRRLVAPPFVAAAVAALEPEGELRFVTDHGAYFEEATSHFAAALALESAPIPEAEMTDLTNYERKYRAEGRPIYRARYRKRPS
ncbi:MAG: tRNA (guanosine(46)-N7)-methyltransferase TrmB [Gemmatimonadota bacterium]